MSVAILILIAITLIWVAGAHLRTERCIGTQPLMPTSVDYMPVPLRFIPPRPLIFAGELVAGRP